MLSLLFVSSQMLLVLRKRHFCPSSTQSFYLPTHTPLLKPVDHYQNNMPVKKEACRNFQRGFCQYGERCKFLHVTQQQPKPTNPFGFGTALQHHQPPTPHAHQNPFGFGTASKSKPQQFKPFENKWSRTSSEGSVPSETADNQSQPASHRCTDPKACKLVIAQDFQNERPLWKLTCYGHWRNLPCDIVGDVSYEELRAAAYNDAKCGLSLQSIVEKERSLLNSKLIEYENLLRSPNIPSSNSALSNSSPFPATTPNSFPPTGPSNAQLAIPDSSQVVPSLNMGFGIRPSAPSNNVFGQPNSFSNAVQSPSAFGTSSLSPGNAGQFGNQPPGLAFGNPPSTAGFSSSAVPSTWNGPFSSSLVSTPNNHLSNVQPQVISSGPTSASNIVEQSSSNIQSVDNNQTEANSVDASIWLKPTWIPGEIPEEAPPEAFV